MIYFLQYPDLLLLFCTVPLLGLLFYKSFPDKVINYILIIAIILLLPALTGYKYVIETGYRLLVYIILSCGYCYFLNKITFKITTSIIASIVLFFPLLFITYFGALAGSTTVEREWELKGYKVQYIKSQGFSGGALMLYKLNKYGVLPIFIKEVDSHADFDTTGNCTVKFEYKNFSFNKCQ